MELGIYESYLFQGLFFLVGELRFRGSTLDHIYNMRIRNVLHACFACLYEHICLIFGYTVFYRGHSGEESFYLMYVVQVCMIKRQIPLFQHMH